MAVNTTEINGFVHQADGSVREKSFVIFEQTGFDTDADSNAVVVSTPIRAPIADDGTISQELWPNPDGVRVTYYNVTFELYNGTKAHLVNGGWIEVPATGGPYSLDGLLQISASSPANPSIQDQLDDKADKTALTAEASTRSAADAALQADINDNALDILGNSTAISNHIADDSNPHSVTKAQVGLGNVDNTSDVDKPISTATQAALTAHTGNVSNPHSVTKAQVGLGDVDNTSDDDKPISTATQAALDAHTGNASNPHSVTKSQVGLGNVDNTSDIDKPVSDDVQAELDALDAYIDAHIADNVATVTAVSVAVADDAIGNDVTAFYDGGMDLHVGWERLFITAASFFPNSSRRVAARDLAELADGQALYIDLTEEYVSEYTVYQGAANGALYRDVADGLKAVLIRAITGRPSGVLAAAVLRSVDARHDDRYSDNYKSTIEAVNFARPVDWNVGRKPKAISSNTYYTHQSSDDRSKLVINNSSCVIDLSFMKEGEEVEVYSNTQSTVYAGEGLTFAGQGSDNFASFLSGASFRAMRFGATNPIVLEVITGNATYSTGTRPAMSRTWMFGGQSQYELGLVSGSLGGLSYEMQSPSVIGSADKASTMFVNGATSGSAIDKRSNATNYWWDASTSSTGPALDNFIAELNAALAAGHPVPEVIFWRQGEADNSAIQTGAITIAEWVSTTGAVFNYILANGAAGAKFICMPPGANDQEVLFRGALSVQNAYLDLAAARSDVTLGCAMFDVERSGYGNVHPTDRGYYTMGVRDAIGYVNANGANVSRGPIMGAATLAADGRSVTFNVNSSHGFMLNSLYDNGPYPFGFCAVIGDTATQDPIALTHGELIELSNTQTTVKLYSDYDMTGARVYSLAGQFPEVGKYRFIRDTRQHGWSEGFPMPFQRSAVLS